jgi:penicillin-insensitive murein endopeptidase
LKLIKRAASCRQVERIFVHPAIKALCQQAGRDQAWLGKVDRGGITYHFHVALSCPPGAAGCGIRNPSARRWLRQGTGQLVRHVAHGRARIAEAS